MILIGAMPLKHYLHSFLDTYALWAAFTALQQGWPECIPLS